MFQPRENRSYFDPMRRRTVLLVASLIGALAVASVALASKPPAKPKHGKGQGPAHHHTYAWQDVTTGTTAHFRGLSVVSRNKVWVSGYTGAGGVVFRTLDHGATWQDVSPAGQPATLQFRDIEAFSANRAVILSAGTGTDSRIYRTTDGGQTWTLVFQNNEPNAFYDCMTFFNKRVGLAVSDPPDGLKFRIIKTTDGGQTWNVVDPAGMPPALSGEFAFAASGQCLTSNHGHTAWLGTGGSAQARVFTSRDRGRTWTVSATPMNSGPTVGINALAFKSQRHGLAVGGDFAAPTASPNNFAKTRNGGATWDLITGAPAEYRSGATWVNGHTAIAVGLSGSDFSRNGGRTWTRFDNGSLDTVDCANPNACWASGANGRVAYLTR
jgi:photosystem II stability/assembly factor-like uncharacterized protein